MKIKIVKNKAPSPRQLARKKAISKVHFVAECTFGIHQCWFGGKILHSQGLAKVHPCQAGSIEIDRLLGIKTTD